MQEIRCSKCNKLLGKIDKDKLNASFKKALTVSIMLANPNIIDMHYNAINEALEIKCPRCGEMNTNKGECQE